MAFSDKLKELRLNANLSQKELSNLSGISYRTIQNYELGTTKPQQLEKVEAIAKALNTSVTHLMDNVEMYSAEAYEKGGAKAAREINDLVSQVTGLFAGGSLDEAAIDGAMRALNEAYWLTKENNKKYIPKKYRK